ncbi:MAG: hypothetical protein FJX99_01710 [Bacteroidetes bacterium]|nr:hypothetical protein [Bacteroidota bacterium]
MNSFINVILLVVSLPTFLLTIFVGYDLPIESLRMQATEIPYLPYIFLGLAAVLFVLSLRRTLRRWSGLYLVNQRSKYVFNAEIKIERKKRVVVYTVLESVLLAYLGYAYTAITPLAIAPSIVMYVFSVEGMIFLSYGLLAKKFRVGITSKAVLVADREVSVLYFSGLRQISISQQTIYFEYIGNLQINFPVDCLDGQNKSDFFETLRGQVDENRVLFRILEK